MPSLFLRRFSLSATAALALAGSLFAQTISVVSSTSDFEPRQRTTTGSFDPGPSITATALRTGFQSDFSFDAAYFFQLPVLEAGQSIMSADFSVSELPDTAATALVPNFNADLVALGFTNTNPPLNTATESQAYFYLGEGAQDTAAGRQLIQDNFLVPADFIPLGGTSAVKSTTANADTVLSGYINGLYTNQGTNGFVPGTSFLILRLNPDIVGNGASGAPINRYRLASAENADATATKPTLTLVTVPEPASGAVLLVGAVGLALRRRRRSRRS